MIRAGILLLLLLVVACSDDSNSNNVDVATMDMGTDVAPDTSNNSTPDMVDMFVPPDECEAAHEADLPAPSGDFCVGLTTIMVTDTSRANTVINDTERDIVVHFYYPTHTSEGEPARPFLAEFTDVFGDDGLDPDNFAGNAIVDAPLAQGDMTFPVLIFMPGYTAPVSAFSSWLEDLASNGWVVVGIEHPGLSFARYPDGTTLAADRPAAPAVSELLTEQYPEVVADAHFVRGLLNNAETMPFDPARLEADEIAYFGQSYGGATAVGACELDSTCVASLNVDGQFFFGEPRIFDVLTKPWGIILSEGRYHEQDMPGDQTLVEMLTTTTATKFYAELQGSTHLGLSDVVFLYQASNVPSPAGLGQLFRLDLYTSVTSIIRTFFDVQRLGQTDVTVEEVASEFVFVDYGE